MDTKKFSFNVTNTFQLYLVYNQLASFLKLKLFSCTTAGVRAISRKICPRECATDVQIYIIYNRFSECYA